MKSASLYQLTRLMPGGRHLTRLCVALPVNGHDIRKGMNARKPGLYLFRGSWYGDDMLDAASYGKIEGRLHDFHGRSRRVGSVGRRVHRLLRLKI